MKMYTTPEQTAKLIELGLKKPRVAMPKFEWKDGEPQFHYTIGELIEMLPEKICIDETLYSRIIDKNDVCYYSWELKTYALLICDVQEELIDNLYDMVVQLKEEKVL